MVQADVGRDRRGCGRRPEDPPRGARAPAGQQRPCGTALKITMLSANTLSPLLGWSTKANWYSTQKRNAQPTPRHRYSAGQQRPCGTALKIAMLTANTWSLLLGWSTKAKWYSTQKRNAHCQHLVTVTQLVNKGQLVQHSKTHCSVLIPRHFYSAVNKSQLAQCSHLQVCASTSRLDCSEQSAAHSVFLCCIRTRLMCPVLLLCVHRRRHSPP